MTTYQGDEKPATETVQRKLVKVERTESVPDFGYCFCGEGVLDSAGYCRACGSKLVWPARPVPVAMQELQEDERMNA